MRRGATLHERSRPVGIQAHVTRLFLVAMAALACFVVADRTSRSGRAPAIQAAAWINGPALSPDDLADKVVLVEFWSLACRSCANVERHVRRWHERYADEGLVVIAVHTPEQSAARDRARVEAWAEERGVAYPVALDQDRSTSRAFGSWASPSFYLIGRGGEIRHHQIGEGGHARTEARIRALLAEAPIRTVAAQ